MTEPLDLEALRYRGPLSCDPLASGTARAMVHITVAQRDAMFAALDRNREYLREKNDIIKAYAGPTGMTPEDVSAALERAERVEAALEGLRGHRQHVSRNIPGPGICVRCRHTWPCDVAIARAALAAAPTEKWCPECGRSLLSYQRLCVECAAAAPAEDASDG